ncbi:hypothetical protein [Deinococcus cellulosilyticus]|uniref:Uncharacterized protein n=1 Tax=Deinococcus cellulosilyticus (strain DSM 18568 / NBRC 106333 / KACC 11606 / 5516J-15) TaxID=1223518 RepID=A0A511NBC0_DEIC1|nr:hypothetical protein [Deinococcus cellulosilyticus]GEM49887.1 hypothetical protein DC3_55220 [Deinococcus cellulosilyticus NBRC 106333 = KACC 11606]
MNPREIKILSAKSRFHAELKSRCPSPEYSLNTGGPGSEEMVVGNSDGSSRVRVVFQCEQEGVHVDLYRPMGMGWNHEPFEENLLDLSRASFLVSEELHHQFPSGQPHE